MTAPPRVSVVMPYLRATTTIGRAIDSVLSQTLTDIELIAVSDGSTDGSDAIVDARAATDARVRPQRLDRNVGPAAARNRAIDAARGEWVAVLDADDAYEPGRIATLVAAAGDAQIVVDNLAGVDPLDGSDAGAIYASLPATLSPVDVVAPAVPGSRHDYGYLKPLVRRDLLQTRRIRYDERLRVGEDMVFLLECALVAGHVRTVDRAGYRYTLQFSPKGRRLSASTHSVPADRAVVNALRALASRRSEHVTPAVAAAIAARCDALHRTADVSSFRHAVHAKRYGDALGLVVRSSRVRGYLWKKMHGASGP